MWASAGVGARRQSLRSPALPTRLPASAHQTTHRPARRRDQPEARGQRWVIERSFAWFNKFRRLTIRYERRLDMHHAFTSIACSIICLRAFAGRF
jgi:transposase